MRSCRISRTAPHGYYCACNDAVCPMALMAAICRYYACDVPAFVAGDHHLEDGVTHHDLKRVAAGQEGVGSNPRVIVHQDRSGDWTYIELVSYPPKLAHRIFELPTQRRWSEWMPR